MVEEKLPDVLLSCLGLCDLNSPETAKVVNSVLKNIDILSRFAIIRPSKEPASRLENGAEETPQGLVNSLHRLVEVSKLGTLGLLS